MFAGRSIAALTVALLMLAGCDSRDETPPAPQDTAFEDMTETIEKARSVESTLQQNKREADEAIDAADGR